MKLFFGILFAAAIIGGLIGAEVSDVSFSILGATIGGVGTGAVLLGLGAYFDAQERKSTKLTPEVRDVFDRMITGKSNPTRKEIQDAKRLYRETSSRARIQTQSPQQIDLSFEGTIKNLMAQDAEAIARGEIPERRLVPHHAIKRDVIIAAYTKDFGVAVEQVRNLSWTNTEKDQKLAEIQKDFNQKIYGIKRMTWEELDKIIALMKKTRTDFEEIEQDVRDRKGIYNMVDPI